MCIRDRDVAVDVPHSDVEGDRVPDNAIDVPDNAIDEPQPVAPPPGNRAQVQNEEQILQVNVRDLHPLAIPEIDDGFMDPHVEDEPVAQANELQEVVNRGNHQHPNLYPGLQLNQDNPDPQ